MASRITLGRNRSKILEAACGRYTSLGGGVEHSEIGSLIACQAISIGVASVAIIGTSFAYPCYEVRIVS